MSPSKRSKDRPPLPEKNTTGKPRPVPPEVRVRQDVDYSVKEFGRALDKATRRRRRA